MERTAEKDTTAAVARGDLTVLCNLFKSKHVKERKKEG